MARRSCASFLPCLELSADILSLENVLFASKVEFRLVTCNATVLRSDGIETSCLTRPRQISLISDSDEVKVA